MIAESGLDPTARNPKDTSKPPAALGINQFSPISKTYQGYVKDIDPEVYLTFPASKQLDYALRFFADQFRNHPAAKAGGARDLYWLNFLPATYVPNAPDSHILAPDPAFNLGADIVNANRSLVLPGETEMRSGVPVIRAGGLKAALDRAANASGSRWNAIVSNIVELGGSLPSLPDAAKLRELAPNGYVTAVGVALVIGGMYAFHRSYTKRT